MTREELEGEIAKQIQDLLKRSGRECKELEANTRVFQELRMDSFEFAELVMLLEKSTGIDPFTQSSEIVPIDTIQDLYDVYAKGER